MTVRYLKRKLIPPVLLMLMCFYACSVSAQFINLEQHDPNRHIGRQVSIFEDTACSLSFDHVRELFEKGQFKKGTNDILNLGNTPSSYWINIRYSTTGKAEDYVIVEGATIEEIDCYVFTGREWKLLAGGAFRKSAPGVFIDNSYTFSVPPLLTGAVKTVWLRVKTRNIMLVPIKLMKAGDLVKVNGGLLKIVEIAFIGILFTLFAFNLFLYFGIKDRIYLYYSIYSLCFGVYVIGYFAGYGYLLGADARIFINQYPHIFFCVATMAALAITVRLYDLRKLSPVFFGICRILFIASMAELVISLLGFKAIAASSTQIISLLLPLTLLSCGFWAHRSGKHPSVYFILAWASIMVAVLIYVLILQNILEYKPFSRLILETGSMLEFLFLALALGQRYHLILENQRKIEEAHLKLVKEQNTRLEQLVDERTTELRRTIAQLKVSDELKNKLFAIVAHDLRTPFNSLLSMLSPDIIESFSPGEIKLFLGDNRRSFLRLKELLDNLLQWVHSQMGEVSTHRTQFNLGEEIGFLISVYESLAQRKGIVINSVMPPGPLMVTADKNHLHTVLRNLIDNAIKFTQPGGTIRISAVSDDQAWVAVKNQTKDPGTLAKFSDLRKEGYQPTYGTGGEKGLGLGLSLCQDYLRRNNSELGLQIDEGAVTLSFSLPLSTQM